MASSSSSGGGSALSLPSFLTKTYEIFNTKEFQDCCGWGPAGDTIIIKKVNA